MLLIGCRDDIEKVPFLAKTFKALSVRNAVWQKNFLLQILWLTKLSSGPLVALYNGKMDGRNSDEHITVVKTKALTPSDRSGMASLCLIRKFFTLQKSTSTPFEGSQGWQNGWCDRGTEKSYN